MEEARRSRRPGAWRGLVSALTLALLALPAAAQVEADPASATKPAAEQSTHSNQGRIYGEVATRDGARYKGFLNWQRARFWDQRFEASKKELPALEQYHGDSKKRFEIFGRKFAIGWGTGTQGRQLSVRFGDLDRIEARGNDEAVLVLREGGTVEVDDLGGDLTVVDPDLGEIEIEWRHVELVQFLATPDIPGDLAARLYGRVSSKAGAFEGFIEWDRQEQLANEELDGDVDDVSLAIEMGRIRSIQPIESKASKVTLLDGRVFELEGTNDVNDENRGIVIEDPRFGRVTVEWDAFEGIEFENAESNGPNYADFAAAEPLHGTVTRTDGKAFRGAIVYDLDEAYGWESLDGRREDVSYSIPFRLIARIEPRFQAGSSTKAGAGDPPTRVTLRGGETVDLDSGQDVSARNAGILVAPEIGDEVLVSWEELRRVELDG